MNGNGDQAAKSSRLWGRNDRIFPAGGGRVFLRDLPEAELHLLGAKRFCGWVYFGNFMNMTAFLVEKFPGHGRGLRALVIGVGLMAGGAQADVLISNFNDHSIVRYSDGGNFLGTLISSGGGGLSLPHRSRIGPDGALYVASAGNDRVLRYDAGSGDFLGVFIDGLASGLDYPTDLVFRGDGYLYVSSQLSNEVLRYDALTGSHDGTYSAENASLVGPSGIVFDAAGDLYAAGRFSDTIVRFDAAGNYEADWAAGNEVFGLALAADGSLFSASGSTNEILRTTNPGGVPVTGTFATGLNFPVGVEMGPDGSLYAANFAANTLQRLDAETGEDLGVFAAGSALVGPNYFTFVAVPEPKVGQLLALVGVGFLVVRRVRMARLVRR